MDGSRIMNDPQVYTDIELFIEFADSERLGDTGAAPPASTELYSGHDFPIPLEGDFDGAQYNTAVQEPYNCYYDTDMTQLQSNDEHGSIGCSSPIVYSHDYTPRPIPNIATPWSQYSYGGHELYNNSPAFEYEPRISSSFSSRILEDDPTNGRFPQQFPPTDFPTAGACMASNNHNDQTVFVDEKENRHSEVLPDQQSASSSAAATPSSRRFRCNTRGCGMMFRRRAELDRHKESVHQPASAGHLCPIVGCNRSTGDNGFSRKDNLRQHLKLKHDIKFEKGRRARKT